MNKSNYIMGTKGCLPIFKREDVTHYGFVMESGQLVMQALHELGIVSALSKEYL